MKYKGGCLCGQVGYEIEIGGGEVADYCHCGQCRKASGAPVTAWVQVAPARFRVTRGEAKAYASSSHSTRWFCDGCGSPVYMTDGEGRSVGVPLGTLDELDAVRPTVHGWVSAAVAWLEIRDGLPRFADAPPYDL